MRRDCESTESKSRLERVFTALESLDKLHSMGKVSERAYVELKKEYQEELKRQLPSLGEKIIELLTEGRFYWTSAEIADELRTKMPLLTNHDVDVILRKLVAKKKISTAQLVDEKLRIDKELRYYLSTRATKIF